MTQPTRYDGVYLFMPEWRRLRVLLMGGWLALGTALSLHGQSAEPFPIPDRSKMARTSSTKAGARVDFDRVTERLSADVDKLPLRETLQLLANATGWEVFFEPGAEIPVSTRFQRLIPSEALPRLTSSLNYALTPQSGHSATLYVYRTTVQEATARLAPVEIQAEKPDEKNRGRIPNELVVALKPGQGGRIEEWAKLLGAKVAGKIEGLDAYRLRFEDEKAALEARSKLEADESVASVESNYSIPNPRKPELLSSSSTPPLNLKPRVNPDGSKIIIGLVDTSVQSQGTALKDFLLPGMTVASEPAGLSREPSHGTSMAETILRGVSMVDESGKGTPVRILPIDVYGAKEETSTFDVARGVYTAIKEGATLVNMSLGSYTDSALLRQIVQQGHRQGVLFFGAAGNEPVTLPTYPAAYPEVVAVTAGDRSGRLAGYANRGDFVDVLAPGAGVVQFNNRSYLGTGTSYSTAYVTGLAAGLAAEPGKTLSAAEQEIRQRLGFRPPVPPGGKP